MKILLHHPVLLPPRDYGGVERVVLWLAKGLVERGHQVFIAALPGSQLPKGCELVNPARLPQDLPKGLDLVHFMAPVSSEISSRLEVPSLLTVHGNGKPGEVFPQNTIFLSRDHARRHGSTEFVYNGIDPSEYELTDRRDQHQRSYLFLSKTSWSVKNVRGAVRLCKSSGQKLKIAGGNRPFSVRLQCLFNPALQWIGPVAGAAKARHLAQARALVFPVLWQEPFGLVVVEALMSGTPVIANPVGSLPELVPSSVGALPSTEEEWLEILRRPRHPWEPEACRAWAMENFHYAKMAENYETIYRGLKKL